MRRTQAGIYAHPKRRAFGLPPLGDVHYTYHILAGSVSYCHDTPYQADLPDHRIT